MKKNSRKAEKLGEGRYGCEKYEESEEILKRAKGSDKSKETEKKTLEKQKSPANTRKTKCRLELKVKGCKKNECASKDSHKKGPRYTKYYTMYALHTDRNRHAALGNDEL